MGSHPPGPSPWWAWTLRRRRAPRCGAGSGPARRPGSRPATRRPTSSCCPRRTRSRSCASACATPSRARCSRSPTPARPSRPTSRPAPTCAPTCRATASGGTASSRTSPPTSRAHWRDDLVAFLIGCSFTFERALQDGRAAAAPRRAGRQRADVPHVASRRRPAGPFDGPLVVSMRPMTPEQAIRATQITTRYAAVHGAPVHVGDPAALGIADLDAPDYGDAGRDPRRRGAGVLGLRRDAPGGRRRQPPRADAHPRARATCSSPTCPTPSTRPLDQATGRTGEPVPPRSFSGRQTNANSRTPSRRQRLEVAAPR